MLLSRIRPLSRLRPFAPPLTRPYKTDGDNDRPELRPPSVSRSLLPPTPPLHPLPPPPSPHPSTQESISSLRAKWQSYLSTGRGSRALFRSFGPSPSNTVPASALLSHLNKVGRVGVRDDVISELHRLGHAALSLGELQALLIRGTKFSLLSTKRTLAAWEESGEVGRREDGEGANLNIEVMSQALRRMQYAVRGEVVMRAEVLAGEVRWCSLARGSRRALTRAFLSLACAGQGDHVHQHRQPARAGAATHHVLPAGVGARGPQPGGRHRPPVRARANRARERSERKEGGGG